MGERVVLGLDYIVLAGLRAVVTGVRLGVGGIVII